MKSFGLSILGVLFWDVESGPAMLKPMIMKYVPW